MTVFTTSIPATRTQARKLGWKSYFLYLESTKACVCASNGQPSTHRTPQIDFLNFKVFRKKKLILEIYKSLSFFLPKGRPSFILIPDNPRLLACSILGCFVDSTPFPALSVQKSCFFTLIFQLFHLKI